MPPSGGARYRQALAGDQHFCFAMPGLFSFALASPEQLTPDEVTIAVPPFLDLALPRWFKATFTLEVLLSFAFEVAVLPKIASALDVLLSFAVELAVLSKFAPALDTLLSVAVE